MTHIHRIIASLSLIALLATPTPTTANVGPVLDKVLLMPIMANNAPALTIIGDGCTTDNCP